MTELFANIKHLNLYCFSSPVSCRASPLLLLRSSSQEFNRKLQMAVFPAGPQPPAPDDGSLPRRNREFRSVVFPAGPQPRASAGSVPHRTTTASQKKCHIERQKECQKECQNECQKKCQKERMSEDMPDTIPADRYAR